MAYELIDYSKFKTQVRELYAKVNVYRSNGATETFDPKNHSGDPLISLKIDRVAPDGKIMGVVLVQQLTMVVKGEISYPEGTRLQLWMGIHNDTNIALSDFFVDKCTYNAKEHKTEIVAYDILYQLNAHIFGEISFYTKDSLGVTTKDSLTLEELARKMYSLIRVGNSSVVNGLEFQAPELNSISYKRNEVNIQKGETLFSAMTALCETLGAICYVKSGSRVVIRHPRQQMPNWDDSYIPNTSWMEFTENPGRYCTKVAHVGALDSSYVVEPTLPDYLQLDDDEKFCLTLYENPFLTLKPEAEKLAVDELAARFGAKHYFTYSLKWRGCPYFEPGDELSIDINGKTMSFTYMTDTLTYNGGLVSEMSWDMHEIADTPKEQPATIGEQIRKTYAQINNIDNTITLVAGDVTQLRLDIDGITAEINSLEKDVNDIIYHSKVGITAKEASLLFEERLKDGLTTSMGYSFDNEGMKISRSTSDITTQITEDGMKVYVGEDNVLTANNHGVEAKNLEASTYLIISGKCYFEYQEDIDRMVCFWI